MKKLLLLTLALMCGSLLYAEDEYTTIISSATSGDFTYEVIHYDGQDMAGIIGFNASFTGEVTIPETLGDYPVRYIGDDAFRYHTGITKVTVPGELLFISGAAFGECRNLTTVTLSSVEEIESFSFSCCESLTTVTLPSNLTSIGRNAFEQCYALPAITIPASVDTIKDYAFNQCSSLENVIFKGTPPATMGTNVFANTATGILGEYPAAQATLWEAQLNNNNTWHGLTMYKEGTEPPTSSETEETSVFTTTTNETGLTITGYTGTDTEVIIPSKINNTKVTAIGGGAFYECSSLTSITIPDGVTYIGANAFWKCSGLTSIMLPDSVKRIDNSSFSNCTALTSVDLGKGIEELGQGCFYYTPVSVVLIPKSVKVIEEVAFGRSGPILIFEGLPPEIKCEDSRPLIADTGSGYYLRAYAKEWAAKYPNLDTGWYGLEMNEMSEITYDEEGKLSHISVAKLNYRIENEEVTITGCQRSSDSDVDDLDGLIKMPGRSIIIPDKIEGYPVTCVIIGDGIDSQSNGFADCPELTSVTIPDSVTRVLSSTYSSSTPFTVIDGVRYESPDRRVFIDGEATEIPETVRFICGGTFNFGTVEHLVLPQSLRSISNTYFSGNISKITFPASCTSLGPFFGCYAPIVEFEGAPPSGQYLSFSSSGQGFYPAAYASEWEDVIVDGKWNGLTMMEISPFLHTVKDGKVTITGYEGVMPSELTIPTEICGQEVVSISESAFSNCTTLTSLNIPASVTSIAKGVFEGCSNITTIDLPEQLATIGANAFKGTTLTTLTLPKSVTTVGEGAFDIATLKTVEVLGVPPNGEGAIFSSAPEGTYSLEHKDTWFEQIDVDGTWRGLTMVRGLYEDERFSYETMDRTTLILTGIKDKSITGECAIPATVSDLPVTTLAEDVLADCTGMTVLRLSANVTSFPASSIRGCTALTRIYHEGEPPAGDDFHSTALIYYRVAHRDAWLGAITNGTWRGLTAVEASTHVTVTTIGRGSVVEDTRVYNWGDALTLTAQPDEGYVFIEWMGDVAAKTSAITLNQEVSKLQLTVTFMSIERLEELAKPYAGANAEEVIADAVAKGEVVRKGELLETVKEMAFGAPVMEVKEKEVSVAISLETAEDLSSWGGLDLTGATLEKDATTAGLFRVRVPIKSNAAFYKFVVKDEAQKEEKDEE